MIVFCLWHPGMVMLTSYSPVCLTLDMIIRQPVA